MIQKNEFDVKKFLLKMGFKVEIESYDKWHYKVTIWTKEPLSVVGLVYKLKIKSTLFEYEENMVLAMFLQQLISTKLKFEKSETYFSTIQNPDDPKRIKYEDLEDGFEFFEEWD